MTEYAEDPLTATPPKTREQKTKEAEERSKQPPGIGYTGGSISKPTIIESFNWPTNRYKKLRSKDPKKVLIKVIAARTGDVSLNKRKYVKEELMKSARTFIGKPITINHDPKQRIGICATADFEDDQLEIIGEISLEPYVSLIRHKRPYFSGVSIEANYRYNLCPLCHERFETDEEFYDHQEREHLIKSNGVKEPHGMVGAGLSMVTLDEQPGIPTASYELMETANGLNRLYEMVVKEKGVIAKLKTKVKEQDEPCPEGQHQNEEGKCVPDIVTEQEPCLEGEHRNKEGECVPDEPEDLKEQLELVTEQFNEVDKAFEEYKRVMDDKVFENQKAILATLKEIKKALSKRNILTETVKFKHTVLTVTDKLKETTDKLQVRVDNLEEKQKGKFSGHAREAKEETPQEHAVDPLTGE